MSNLKNVTRDLEQLFVDSWDDSLPVQYQNKKKVQPNASGWVNFGVIFGDAFNVANCGNGIEYRQAGSIIIDTYTAENQGGQAGYAVVDQIRGFMSNKVVGIAETGAGFIGTPEYTENWFKIMVSIPFSYETR